MSKKLAKVSKKAAREIPAALIRTVARRLAENKRVRRTLPRSGRLHIDRQLPFLCIYRRPPNRDDTGTSRLVSGEASYLVSSGATTLHASLSALVESVVQTMAKQFGAFLIVEVWSAPDGGRANDPAQPSVLPSFRVVAPKSAALTKTVDALVSGLKLVRVLKQGVEVEVLRQKTNSAPGLKRLLSKTAARESNVSTIGVEVPPVYRHKKKGDSFPLVLQSLRRSIGLALRRGIYEFARHRTTHRPAHFHALGRNAVVKAVWNVDQQLAEVSNAFDYLLQLTPVNSNDAWNEFRRSKMQQIPEFHYRPLPMDPGLLKRKLFNIPMERVEDPALHELFQEKQSELERKITMLEDRDTPRFLHGSMQLFGDVEDDLLELAKDLLKRLGSGRKRDSSRGELSAEEFAQRVRQEIDHYRQTCPDFTAKARVVGDVAGLIVSRGSLLIARNSTIPVARVEALLAHEVGTHLLTYFNGRAQPFRQLYSGLAGYEELQEGLAVLSEYLVGGLSRSRMKQLAARVVAARMLIDGASFIDTYRVLDDDHGFTQRPAFNITMRIYRGGGLTKDIVYLRGLRRILKYVQRGGQLDPMLVGKMAVEHIPIIKELQFRKVLKPPPSRPRYLQDRAAIMRLESLRGGSSTVLELVD